VFKGLEVHTGQAFHKTDLQDHCETHHVTFSEPLALQPNIDYIFPDLDGIDFKVDACMPDRDLVLGFCI
jgi:hypothetical protein